MAIRVISGKARGRKLKLVPGDTTRPVMDRVKENVFNIISLSVPGSRWCDLFAGTGSIGIEALSRGAEFCQFYDTSKAAIQTIQENLQLTRLAENAKVDRADALVALSNTPKVSYEFIYVAPPQYLELWKQALVLIDTHPDWLYPDGVAIVQIDPKEYEEISLQNLRLYDQRTYGNTMLAFYERPGE
jgi:16S rRNA (guanine966-N2)-methyltransferase